MFDGKRIDRIEEVIPSLSQRLSRLELKTRLTSNGNREVSPLFEWAMMQMGGVIPKTATADDKIEILNKKVDAIIKYLGIQLDYKPAMTIDSHFEVNKIDKRKTNGRK